MSVVFNLFSDKKHHTIPAEIPRKYSEHLIPYLLATVQKYPVHECTRIGNRADLKALLSSFNYDY